MTYEAYTRGIDTEHEAAALAADDARALAGEREEIEAAARAGWQRRERFGLDFWLCERCVQSRDRLMHDTQ